MSVSIVPVPPHQRESCHRLATVATRSASTNISTTTHTDADWNKYGPRSPDSPCKERAAPLEISGWPRSRQCVSSWRSRARTRDYPTYKLPPPLPCPTSNFSRTNSSLTTPCSPRPGPCVRRNNHPRLHRRRPKENRPRAKLRRAKGRLPRPPPRQRRQHQRVVRRHRARVARSARCGSKLHFAWVVFGVFVRWRPLPRHPFLYIIPLTRTNTTRYAFGPFTVVQNASVHTFTAIAKITGACCLRCVVVISVALLDTAAMYVD